MSTFTVESSTPETLADLFALRTDVAGAERRLAALRERLDAGAFRPEQGLVLRSTRGVEATALLSGPPQVPLIPTFRADIAEEAVTLFARALRERAAPQRLLLVQNVEAAPMTAALEAADWALDAEHVIYETDLHARPHVKDPAVSEGGQAELTRSGVQRLLAQLGRKDFELPPGWRLALLEDAGRVMAAGAVGPAQRPDLAGIDLIGVLPEARGQNLGARLHAHLLALAAERFDLHAGGTDAGNVPMRRIFERHGAQLRATQLYFRQA